ncbi:PqqD family protein [bacterium]|nr:PqqD family protein [candidate division CSSED10-310 bacterium]
MNYYAEASVSCRVEEPEGALLFHPGNEALRIINPIGLMIWNKLNEPVSLEQVTDRLLADGLDVEPAALTRDIREFLEDLIEAGMVLICTKDPSDG